MSFSQRAALNVVPLLARLVLGAAFVTAGWNKLMTERNFGPNEIAVLRDAGVPAATNATATDSTEAPLPELRLRSLHGVTVLTQQAGWPYARWLAWAATATELLGGALIVLGLFSRVWGLGLAGTMGVAFYLTSWPLLKDTLLFNLPIADYNRLFAQAGLFVLALGVALSGPGALSLDRAIFRRAPEPID